MSYETLYICLATLGGVPLLVILTRIVLRCTVRTASSADAKGKVVIVTGGNSGIGYETALELAGRGARVILACRSEARALTARAQILAKLPQADVLYMNLDLASLDSVRRFAAEVLSQEARLDVLINNAGVFDIGNRHSQDGIVLDMQVNFFGPFLLTTLLLPLLKKTGATSGATGGARLIFVSSVLHFLGTINFACINREGYYSGLRNYYNSKLCLVTLAAELARRLRGQGVSAFSLHPGIIATEVMTGKQAFFSWVFSLWCWVCHRTPAEGAQTSVHLSVAPDVAARSGGYFVDCSRRPARLGAAGPALGAKLWTFAATLVGSGQDVTVM